MIRTICISLALMGAPMVANADEQVPPVQNEARERVAEIPYSLEAISTFVETEFSKAGPQVKTAPVIEILMKDLSKAGSGGFRIGPQGLDYTFEYLRVGDQVHIDKVSL
ncbi:MAG: hypothetical protein ACPGTU_08385 [Myxococcota bacterium]